MICGHCVVVEKGTDFRDFLKETKIRETLEKLFDDESVCITRKKMDSVFVLGLAGEAFCT